MAFMALAIVVTLEGEAPEAAAPAKSKTAPGKALVRESDRLDFAAKRANVTALTSLLSENPEVLAAQMREEGFDPSRMRLPPEQWFAIAEGLKSARGLITFVGANLNDFKQPNPILRDLKAIEESLVAVEGSGKRFHLSKKDV